MPEAGWYDDPLVPGGTRYWDGAAWTPSAQGPGSPPELPPPPTPTPSLPASSAPGSGPIHGHSPPFEPIPASVAATGRSTSDFGGGGLGDIGEWINQTFRGLRDNAIDLLLLLFVIPAVFWAVGYLASYELVSDLEWVDGEGFSGLNASVGIIAAAGFAAMFLAFIVGGLAANHLLFGYHVGQTPSWMTSFGVGLMRLPRMLLIGLLLIIVVVVIMAVPALLISAGVYSGGSSLFALIGLTVVTSILAAPLLVWIWVKTGFVWVSAAVTPSGTSALRSSFEVSSGRFWSVLARMGILFSMSTFLSSVAQTIAQFAAPVVLFGQFETGPTGQLVVNGQELANLDQVRVGDLLPSPIGSLVYLTVFVLVSAAGQALIGSGLSSLYAKAKAPNSFGVASEAGFGVDGNLGHASPLS